MSQEELVDILDEKGKILKTVTKKQAHVEGLLHACVIGMVIDSKGRWLLVLQSSDRQDAGQYVSPVGGHVTSGEKEDDALRREAFEELGLSGNLKFELLGKAVFNREVIGRKENHLFVAYKIFTDIQPKLNEESASCNYFAVQELKSELKNHPEHFGNAFHFCVKNFYLELQ